MDGRPYEIVDVFTDHPYAGNPLAIVLEGQQLDPAQMQAVAREFNLSETTFVLPPAGSADYRVRIFTPVDEVPFAGHPSVGTAVTLARLGRIGTGAVVQECGAGLLPIEVAGDRGTLTGAEPTLGPELHPGPFLAVAGLDADDLVGPPVRRAGAGLDHTFVLVSDAAVSRARLDAVAARRYDVAMVTVFSWDPDRCRAHARMFGPGVGVAEDPATGSAALGLGVWLVATGTVAGDGVTAYTVDQGAEIGRPSRLDCTVEAAGGQALRATVTGRVVPVASGRIAVP